MKSIGLIGGLTYVSTIEYYRYINELANEKIGGNETIEVIMYSVNFGEIKVLTEAGDWRKISDIICKIAQTIEQGGASCLLIGANTMQLGFYTDHLAKHGIETIIPDQEDIDFLNYTIYNEFSKNLFLPQTKAGYLNVISKLKERGAEGIILGCTEIPLLLKQSDCDILLFDTAKIHSNAGVDHVLSL